MTRDSLIDGERERLFIVGIMIRIIQEILEKQCDRKKNLPIL
jgi:hypothetical protein